MGKSQFGDECMEDVSRGGNKYSFGLENFSKAVSC